MKFPLIILLISLLVSCNNESETLNSSVPDNTSSDELIKADCDTIIVKSYDEFEKEYDYSLKEELITPRPIKIEMPKGKLIHVKDTVISPLSASNPFKSLSIDIRKSGKKFDNNIYMNIIPYFRDEIIEKGDEFKILFTDGTTQVYKYHSEHTTSDMCTFLLDDAEKIDLLSSKLIKKIRFYSGGENDFSVDTITAMQIKNIINCLR